MKNNFIPPVSLIMPVLFMIFNRPDTTQKVFNAIRQAKPKQLFVAADGPRLDEEEEIEKCQKAREIAISVDWDCEVKTLFRDKNLGCKIAVSSAIDWFFKNVKEGIILEDDCLPSQSFFWFCQELLEYYRNDTRIMMVSGMNYLFNKVTIKESYFFSKIYAVWGWGTWRRAWMNYDINMSNWPEFRNEEQLTWIFSDKEIIEYYTNMFQAVYSKRINTWDIQWVYSCIFNNGLSIVPGKNLISNIGTEGTHTGVKPSIFVNMHREEIDINNIKHPIFVIPNILYNKVAYYTILTNGNKTKSVIVKFLKRIKIFNYINIIYRKLKNI
jgi:hypothetical protein